MTALAAAPARAHDEPLSLQGMSGLLDTPTAWTHAPGSAHLLYTDQQEPGFRRFGWTHTFLLSAGFLPYTEASLRVTEVERSPLRDLSLNAKVQLPLDLLWPGAPVAFAVGTQDDGGAAAHFRTRYAVASVRAGPLGASVGYGTGPDRMKGVFGGASLRLASFAEALGDWDGLDLNVGVRAAIPVRLGRVRLTLDGLAKTSLSHRPGLVHWGAGVTVPLALGEEGGARAAAAAAPRAAIVAATGGEPAGAPPPALDAIGALQQDLVEAGFENVRVGVDADALVVEYENDVYARAEADALGVVLGHVAWRAPENLARFAVAIERTQVPLVEVSGSLPALRAWFGTPAPEPAAPLAESLALRWHPRRRAAAWWSEAPARSSALRPQLLLGPGLRTFIATEISVLEYVLSVRPEARVPLWAGSMVYARWDVPFAWSAAFDDQGPLRLRRPGARLDHALLYQALPLAPGLTLLAGGGVYRVTSAGALGELAWTPGAGELALAIRAAYTREVEGRRSGDVHESLVASARYRFAPLDLVARVSAGRFYENDRGAEVELSRFFGDTSVGVFYARTDVPILGVRLSLPLTPRREMASGPLQIRGTPLWEYDLYTVVQRRTNDVLTGIGVDPVSPWNLEDSYLDRSRLTLSALVRALPRARASFDRWAARNDVFTDQ